MARSIFDEVVRTQTAIITVPPVFVLRLRLGALLMRLGARIIGYGACVNIVPAEQAAKSYELAGYIGYGHAADRLREIHEETAAALTRAARRR